MSNVIIVETFSVYDNDSQLSVHEDYDDALNFAASKMYCWFDRFGFDDPLNIEDHQIYTEVHDLITAGDIQSALDVFNDIDNIESSLCFRISVVRYEVKSVQKKLIQSQVQPKVDMNKEFACPICQKNNYVGEAICWNCGNTI